jgi:hypothetical protein
MSGLTVEIWPKYTDTGMKTEKTYKQVNKNEKPKKYQSEDKYHRI